MTISSNTSTTPRRARRMAPEAQGAPASPQADLGSTDRAPRKLDCVEALLLAAGGASIFELVAATGWQQHSVRGAMAGALKKRGLAITSDKVDGVRRYRASKAS
jgi:hypothetical protein